LWEFEGSDQQSGAVKFQQSRSPNSRARWLAGVGDVSALAPVRVDSPTNARWRQPDHANVFDPEPQYTVRYRRPPFGL